MSRAVYDPVERQWLFAESKCCAKKERLLACSLLAKFLRRKVSDEVVRVLMQ